MVLLFSHFLDKRSLIPNDCMLTAEKNSLSDLILAVAEGDLIAFQQLYNRHIQKVYSYSYFLTRSTQQAEDLSQELFTKIWIKRAELKKLDNFEAWLTVLIRNQVYNYLKRNALEQKNLKKIYQLRPVVTNSTEEIMLGKEYDRLYEEAVNQLPPQQKKVFLLSRKDGLKHEEIAHNLGISLNTVKNHMKAALFSIKTYLKGYISSLLLFSFWYLFY